MAGRTGAGVRVMLAGVCVALALTGCSRKSGPLKVPVSGVVTLDGTPVSEGQIVFSDPAGVQQSYAGEIRKGEYVVQSTIGAKKVSISSMQMVSDKQGKYGGIQGDPVSAENPSNVYQEAVPAKYNAKTELTIEVKESGKNEFPFSLTTK
ncbi:hypothetical protein [Planctomyces sp. SH-PL14]|uniref:hypothetical protein n=1 Tax=Planctomyces sp. SH-PL14 TaxID=1632864 RepID=UPI00078C9516|nr:hypothetical protein [Planctomyces sp. SH-PL14]AMV19073.1 hypothetical protein VT03_14375 [Planctomyces sp. SH-PL14]